MQMSSVKRVAQESNVAFQGIRHQNNFNQKSQGYTNNNFKLDAYSNMLAALRAQGPPTVDKLKLLKDVAVVLHIPQERCKAEIRKVVLDEKLNTIAYYTCGQVETTDEWIKEGRRLISLMPRAAAETIYSAIADEVADAASLHNEQLPLPAHTERKRSGSSSQGSSFGTPECSKSHQFKMPECLKGEDSSGKKRKLVLGVDNSTLAQHLIGPTKIGKIQQIYRQKNKSKTKDHHLLLPSKPKPQEQDQPPRLLHTPYPSKPQRCPLSVPSTSNSSPKINILQSVAVLPIKKEEEIEEATEVSNPEERLCESPQPGCSNENQTLKPLKQALVNIKPSPNITYKHVASPGPSSELPKSLKICSTRKHVTKTLPGQKLVIVSNAQSITNSSILQRTLTIPFKNISVKNFDKFKIVSTSTNPSNLQITTLTNSSQNTSKHKVVTVKSSSATKKVIPLAHLHALNAKGSLKMFPIGSKLLSKTTAVSPPAYVTSNMDGVLESHGITKSITSTPVIMTCRPQESIHDEKVEVTENGEINLYEDSDSTKSALLDDGIQNSPSLIDDIESQITQLTAIPQTVPDKILADVHVHEEFETTENIRLLPEELSSNHNSNGSTSSFGNSQLNEDIAVLSMNVNSNMNNLMVNDNATEDEIVLNKDCAIEQMTSNLIN